MASLVILGTTIALILVADSRTLAQLRACDRQVDASEIARELITNWRIEGADLAIPMSGTVSWSPRWTWVRTSERRFVHEQVPVIEVTLTLTLNASEHHPTRFAHEYRWIIHEPRV